MTETDNRLKADLIAVIEDAANECVEKAKDPYRADTCRSRSKDLARLAKSLKKLSTKTDEFQRYFDVAKDAESKGVLEHFYAITKEGMVIRGVGGHPEPQAFLDGIVRGSKGDRRCGTCATAEITPN